MFIIISSISGIALASIALIPIELSHLENTLVFKSFVLPDNISLPIIDVEGLESYIDKLVVCGIRPEAITDLELLSNNSNAEVVEKEVLVDVVEPAGSDTFAILELGEKQVVARLNGNSRVSAGEKVKLTFNLSQIVFFDKKTEERIR